jgi:parallel beta-helix repeat protein
MDRKAYGIFSLALVWIVLISGCVEQRREGENGVNQTWSGEVLITGDVFIRGDLTILPGTIIRFEVGDDQNTGEEIEPDGYNDLDPTRLLEYEKVHSGLYVSGKLTAVGTPDEWILFTSAAEEPNYADWVSVGFGGDGSIIEYCIVEWSRNGITPGRNQPNTIIRNNVINYTLWGSISSGYSGAHIYNNEIWETGHEGIDVQGNDPLIENNVIHNANAGIVILSGSAIVRNNTMINVGGGIHVARGATPTLENNHIEYAPEDSTMEWRYGDFAYTMVKEKD